MKECHEYGIAYASQFITHDNHIAYLIADKCNDIDDYPDASVEFGCQRNEDQFTCYYIKQSTCAPRVGCISKTDIDNGFLHYPGKRIPWSGFDRIHLHTLKNTSQCNDFGFSDCDISTCYNSNFSNCVDICCFSSHVICTSHCDDKDKCSGVFQCNDNGLILFSQFCDGIVDCVDGSDEIENQPGFKCNKCVLPQNNDNIAHYKDSSDLCLRNSNVCFQCYDKRLLISSKQVCNGVRDCYDLSDECLCEKYFDTEECVDMLDTKMFQCFDNANITKWHNSLNVSDNISGLSKNPFVKCNTKYNSSIYAVVCDGRLECKD